MKKQEPHQVLQWLAPIIHTDPRTLDALPNMVLCELLLASQSGSSFPSQYPCLHRLHSRFLDHGIRNLQRLLGRIKQFFSGTTPQATNEILHFFLGKFSSSKVSVHAMAKRSLSLLFNFLASNNDEIDFPEDDTTGWLEKIKYARYSAVFRAYAIIVYFRGTRHSISKEYLLKS